MASTTIGLRSGNHVSVLESRDDVRAIMENSAQRPDGFCVFTAADGFGLNRKFDVKEKDIVYLSYIE